MAGTSWDVILDSVKARIDRSVEGGGYRERYVRAEISQNLLSQQEETAQRSRPDGAALYQTNWSGGSRWWKPLLAGEEVNSYHISNNMDLWSEPGKVVPGNSVDTTIRGGGDGPIRCWAWGLSGGLPFLYGIGTGNDSQTTDFCNVVLYASSSGQFVTVTGIHSTVDIADHEPISMAFDSSDTYFYILVDAGVSGAQLNRFSETQADEDAAWITGITLSGGADVFVHQGSVWLYNGDTLSTVNKSGPALVEQFDDGLGPDVGPDASSAAYIYLHRCVATPEGIYYAKNVMQGDTIVSYILRVDRDASGAYIGQPVATLPAGVLTLELTYHLGSLILSTSDKTKGALSFGSSTDPLPTTFYYVNQDSMGVLGSAVGDRDPDETVWKFLGTDGPFLYIGGNRRIWVYDAISGGMHVFYDQGSAGNTPYNMATEETTSPAARFKIFSDNNSSYWTFLDREHDNPDTVSAFGDDETYYTLESNYFDGSIPMETKLISKVEILFDPGTQTNDIDNQEWTVQISADDGAFTDVLTSASDGYDTLKGYGVAHSDIQGRRFRYKLIYQTKTAHKLALRSILVTLWTGEMVREWDLILDGRELLSMDNVPQDPATFMAGMQSIGASDQVIPVIFNFDDIEQDTSDAATPVYCKVQALELVKSEPGESQVRVTLREAPSFPNN